MVKLPAAMMWFSRSGIERIARAKEVEHAPDRGSVFDDWSRCRLVLVLSGLESHGRAWAVPPIRVGSPCLLCPPLPGASAVHHILSHTRIPPSIHPSLTAVSPLSVCLRAARTHALASFASIYCY